MSFVTAAQELLNSEQLGDFSIALRRRSAGGGFVAHDSRERTWEAPFVQRKAELFQEIRREISSGEKALVVRAGMGFSSEEGLEGYRCEILKRIGSAQAVLLFIGEHADPMTLAFSVLRLSGAREFEQGELERLESFRRYIDNAWALLCQRLLSRVLLDGISLALRNYHLGTVMLDSRLRVVWHNRASQTSILAWKDDGRGQLKVSRRPEALPTDILATCERLRDEWIEKPGAGRLRKTHLVRHPTVPAHYATVRLCGASLVGTALPNFIVQFERQSTGTCDATTSVVDSLTTAERQVANLVREGMSNQEIASELGKSVESVKFHLHRMFKKAGVTTRSRLMLALVGAK
ncbi:MAG: helix-turn-helix transcriptional regulator [Nibricoccus sp.]